MKELPIDEAWFARAELGFRRRRTTVGEVYRFELPDRSNIVEAEVVGGALMLVPQRSADHRALLARLEAAPETVTAKTVL